MREQGGVASCRGIAVLSLGRHTLLAVWKVVVCACRLRGRGSLNGWSVFQPRLAGSKVLDERRQPPLDSPIALVLMSEIRRFHAGARRTLCQLEQCSGWVAPAAFPHAVPAGVGGGWDANLILIFQFQIFLMQFRSFARRTRRHSRSSWGCSAPAASPHADQRRWGVVWAAQTCSLVPFEFWAHQSHRFSSLKSGVVPWERGARAVSWSSARVQPHLQLLLTVGLREWGMEGREYLLLTH